MNEVVFRNLLVGGFSNKITCFFTSKLLHYDRNNQLEAYFIMDHHGCGNKKIFLTDSHVVLWSHFYLFP